MTARILALARRIRVVVVVAGSVACRMTSVVGVVRLLPFCWLLLVGRVLQTLCPRVLRQAVREAVQHAQSATAAFCSASRHRLLVNRLIVVVAILFAIQA